MAVVNRLGIDFGTSNSAAGFLHNGAPRLIEVEPGQTTLPTAFFFDYESRQTLIGTGANAALLDGLEGRYMRALKRVLGTSLMHEPRQILNEKVTFVEIIARFLSLIKTRAEATTGMRFERALSGRPVRFHSADKARDAQAEEDLRQCYLAAGFQAVDFLPEPEAAAVATRMLTARGGVGLVVDIGGGTSDFSLFETNAQGEVNILANQGIRVGGTDFDRVISFDHVMPLVGKGSLLRKDFGPGTLTAPNAIFQDMATWEKIPFLYTAKTRRMVGELQRQALEPEKIQRLLTLLELELGHDLAFAVERGKIAVNAAARDPNPGNVEVDLGFVETDFHASFSPADLQASLQGNVRAIQACARETVEQAGLSLERVDHIVFVGGSSLMHAVSTAIEQTFPTATPVYSEVFTAVADGLAIAAG